MNDPSNSSRRRVVLVTGARRGLGQAIAAAFARQGDIVIGTDLVADMPSELRELGIELLEHDISSELDWQRVSKSVQVRYGGIDVLVNNAGTEGKPDQQRDPIGSSVDDWDFVFSVNCRGPFLGCKTVLPAMKSNGGSIVNVSSVAADLPTPFLTAYGASKAAVDHLTRTVALYVAQEGWAIRCNCVHPGQARTPMLANVFAKMAEEAGMSVPEVEQQFQQSIPLGELQEPTDIADAVLFFASDQARMITGQILAVDGGFVLAGGAPPARKEG